MLIFDLLVAYIIYAKFGIEAMYFIGILCGIVYLRTSKKQNEYYSMMLEEYDENIF